MSHGEGTPVEALALREDRKDMPGRLSASGHGFYRPCRH